MTKSSVKEQIDHLKRLGRLTDWGTLVLPVVIDGKKAHIQFDERESQRFPGYIWIAIIEKPL